MTKVIEKSELDPGQQLQWNAQLSTERDVLASAGATCRFEIARLVDRVLVPPDAARVIWSVADNDGQSFLSCHIDSKSAGPFAWSELRPITDRYPGRSAPIVCFGDVGAVRSLIKVPFDKWSRWDCFRTDALANGAYERELVDVADASGFAPFIAAEIEIPYILLPDNWDELYGNFSKKFRYNIRQSQNQLGKRGKLELRCFTEASDVEEFLGDFLSVERLSWKQEAGTSITQNPEQLKLHSELAPIAAAGDIFRGYILYLDETPIAHIYGLYDQGTFYCLKLSYVEALKKFGPGIAITAMAIKDLIDNSARLWDFVGPTEGYKRRWAKESYTIRKYVFFSRTLRGRMLNMCRRLRSFIRQPASK